MKGWSIIPQQSIVTIMLSRDISIQPEHPLSQPSAGRTRLRRLPPAGGPIAYGAVFSSLRQSVTAACPDQSQRETLCRQLAACIGPQHWVFTHSGRSALSLALMALHARHPQCDEVIIPAYTSYSVPAAVVRAGLRVRLCD